MVGFHALHDLHATQYRGAGSLTPRHKFFYPSQARADLEMVCELQPRNAAAHSLLRSPMLSGTVV